MNIVSELFNVISSVITGLMSAIVSAFSGLIEIFYDSENGFTLIGTLLLVGLGMSIVWFAFRFITNLIRR